MLPSNKFFTIEESSPGQRKKTLRILLFIAVFSITNVYLNPLKHFFNIINIPSVNGCPLLTFAGIACPFCGMGRVFSCLTDLYIARSFYYNPLGLVFYIASGLAFGAILILSILKKRIVLTKSAAKLWFIPLLFIAVMWILNILFGHHH
jgi:hypothetical protein